MEMANKRQSWQESLVAGLGNLPGISTYVRSRGWPFLLSWAHRITGVLLTLYLAMHVYTLSALTTPGEFAAKMAFYDNTLFSFLEWAVAVPLIFHALNGARLTLFELFHIRDERIMIQWVTILGMGYMGTLAYVIAAGNQNVSFGIFWLITCFLSCMTGGIVYRRALKATGPALWKLQRISGGFLLPMASAHMLFMHINYLAGHDAPTVLLRMHGYFAKGIDLAIFGMVLFHSTYGLCGLISDYVCNDTFRRLLAGLAMVVMGVCAIAGIRLVMMI